MITSVVMGQDAWSFRFADTFGRSRITDIVETGSGYVAAITQYNLAATPSRRSYLAHVDYSGSLTDIIRLWGDSLAASVWALSQDGSGKISAVGDQRVVEGDESFCWYASDGQLQRIDSASYRASGLWRIFLDNVHRESNGDLIILGNGAITEWVSWNTIQLIRINQNGDSLAGFQYVSDGILAGRDITRIHEDTLLVTAYGVPQLPFFEYGFASYSKFSNALELVDGFVGQTLDGAAGPLTFQNNISDLLHMSQLPSGDLIVSGRRGAGSSYRAVIQKITTQGDWLAAYLPESEYPLDHPAALRSSIVQDDRILLAAMENFFVGQLVFTPFLPDIPNRVRVHQLDTSLNVQCSYVVDGIAENAYYWVDRIKATNDGGFILCGGRVDLNAPQFLFEGWAQKFGPEDCTVGIQEDLYLAPVRIFPNPGTEGFTLIMNGPDRSAVLELYDMEGKVVCTGTMAYGTIQVDASDLATGMYMYRLVDPLGMPLASGRWIKE
ncbi:MAG: T9SS type A sorting domain-containing protein [Flavobacteriales bacterium]|nr:T9SS type A sorting domain-containing protein [Flavobacteriales bacterium]